MRPNILLLVLDTARADAFEPYGAAAGASPSVADLVASGSVAPLAYAPSSWTVPSHAAMFAGRLPRALGLGQAPGGNPAGVREVVTALRPQLLPTVLQDAGYRTLGASCNSWISPASGFDTGFDEFVHVASPRLDVYAEPGLRGTARWLWEGARARLDDGAAAVAAHVRRWIEDGPTGQPVFGFVNLVECHSPYLPPRPWNDLPLGQRLRAARDVGRYQTLETIWRHCTTDAEVPVEAVARMRHLYGRSILALDAWIGRVLELLDDHGILDDTIVVVTSDHGENFGEGGLIGHAFSLDERLIRVPLLARGLDLPAGPIGLERLPALVAEGAGVTDHPWSRPPRSVAVAQFDPLVDPRDDGAATQRLDRVAHEWGLDGRGRRMFTEPLTCATDGSRKLLRWGDEDLWYDLHDDPGELAPRAGWPDDPGTRPLSAALSSPEPWATPEGAGDGSSPRAAASDVETAALEAQMRLLGYL